MQHGAAVRPQALAVISIAKLLARKNCVAAEVPAGNDRKNRCARDRGTPLPPGCFLEVLILHDFKSFAPELVILKGLKCDFSEVLILEELRVKTPRAVRIFCSEGVRSRFIKKHNTEHTIVSTYIDMLFE